MLKVIRLVIFWAICVLNADSKHLPQREKRFVLQPVPTPTNQMKTRNTTAGLQSFITGSSLMNSVVVQCPLKRSASIKRVLLNDNLMKALYLELIGNINQSNFAVSLEEAVTNFQHILTFPTKTTRHRHHHGSREKSVFVSDLTKYQSWYQSVLEGYHNKNDTDELSATLSNGSGDKLDDVLKRIDITKAQLKHIIGLVHEIDDIKDFRLSNKRIKRTTIGAVQSKTEYCNQRGTPIGNGYLRMCSACAMTTQFPEDMFPRYSNEITCDEADCDCFQVKNTAHGKCQPIIKSVKMLKRKRDGCRMIIKNGQQIIVDDWELYEQPLHVGCECMFKKNSLFAQFIQKP